MSGEQREFEYTRGSLTLRKTTIGQVKTKRKQETQNVFLDGINADVDSLLETVNSDVTVQILHWEGTKRLSISIVKKHGVYAGQTMTMDLDHALPLIKVFALVYSKTGASTTDLEDAIHFSMEALEKMKEDLQ